MTTPDAGAAPAAEQRSELPKTDATSPAPAAATPHPHAKEKHATFVPSVIVGLVVAAVAGLSIWYLVRPEPLLVQGEVDATRYDIAARVDGRVAEIPVERGQNVEAGAVLVKIDNPETIAKNEQSLAAKVVAEAQLANINAGHTRRGDRGAQGGDWSGRRRASSWRRRPMIASAQLAATGNAPQARVDQTTDALHESQRAADQAKSAYEQAVNGYTKEEHEIAAGECRQSRRRHQGRPIDHRPDGGLRAGRFAGLSAQRRTRRIRVARRAAGDADRSQ